jgi:sec-independent protein translocase protein TatB
VFNLSGSELVFLLLLALIVLGPEKLPEAVRKFGKTYSEVKKMSSGFQNELKNALDEPMREMRETADALRKAVDLDGVIKPNAEPNPQPNADDKPRSEGGPTDVKPADVTPEPETPKE